MPSAALANPILTTDDVATMLSFSVHAVRRLHRSRRLTGFVVAGKLRFRLSAVEEYLCEAENRELQS